jgi:hypothetical protein
MISRKVDSVDCKMCYSEEIYMDVKQEASVYKVGAYCTGCDHDYGVVTRLSRSNIENVDEVFEFAEESVTDLLKHD